MQCVSCQFFNVPGSLLCGRCGTTLRFDQMTTTTTPPRAPKHGRWLRNIGLGWLIQSREAVRAATTVTARETRPLIGETPPPLDLFYRMLVPGWALRRVGLETVGWLVLAVWGLLLVLSVVFMGWQVGGLCLGLAFAVHYISGLAAVRIAGYDRVYTFRLGAIIAITLLITIYIPGPILVQQVVRPVEVNVATGPFSPGDTVLYAPWSSAASGNATPGQWIIFDLPERFSIHVGRDMNAVVEPGLYMTQVLAKPGDRIVLDQGELRVNGEMAAWQPTASRATKKKQERVLEGERYFVAPWIPELIQFNNPNYPALRAGPLNLDDPSMFVEFRRIEGRVFLRLHPLHQMQRIR